MVTAMYSDTTKFNQLSRKKCDKLVASATKHYQAMEDFEVRCKSGKVIKCHIYLSQFDEGYAAFDVTNPNKHQRLTDWSGFGHFSRMVAHLYGYAMEN